MSDGKKYFQTIDTTFNPKATYEFQTGGQMKVAHLLALSFPSCGKELIADTPVPDPENPDSKIETVGVFDYIHWAGGSTDPLKFTFRLSPANIAILKEGLTSLTGGAEVEAKWIAYQYDYKEKKYFKHFHTDSTNMKFILTKGTEVVVATDPDPLVQQPMNFVVTFSLTPKNEQQVHVAYSATTPMVLQCGTTNQG